MKHRPLIVSYYTAGTLYEKEAGDLIDSCKKFDLEYQIESIPNKGSWSKNCCYKPTFLLKKLSEHGRPLVWTDIDSVFVQKPSIFEECFADVALRINDQLPENHKSKIMTGTFFVNNTPSAKKLLQLWEKECERSLAAATGDELVFDQVCLRRVVHHYPTIVEMRRLPASYVRVVDHPKGESTSSPEDAVVVHYQASRLYQKMVDNELVASLGAALSGSELKKIRTE